jgi:hypothetical protein
MKDMTEVYKAEVECLRNLVRQCGELLFKYGWKFDENDRSKATTILASIKRAETDRVNMWLANQSQAKFEQITEVTQ